MTTLSRLLSVNLLYSFIAAALSVMVPLYLVEREIDIASIGITLSVIPLTFMIMRVFFASIADGVGTRIIAFIYGIANLLAISIYGFTNTSLGFVAGTMMEGVRNSGFWAISRTEVVFQNGKKSAGKVLAYFGGIRQLADGFGRLSVGFLIAALAFGNTFLLLGALSFMMLMLIVSLNQWKLGEFVIDKKTLKRIFSNRPRSFWFNAFGLTSISITSNMLLQFLLPLYSRSFLGLTFEETGTLVAVFSLLSGAMMMVFLWKKISAKPLIALAAIMIPVLLLVPFAGDLIFFLVIILAIGNGASMIVAEYILADSVKDSGEISTDIGLIYMPLRLSEFIFLFCAGFIIAGFGYAPLFIICAACVAFFIIFARKYFK